MSRAELEALETLLMKYVWSHASEALAQHTKPILKHTRNLKGRAD